MIHFVAIISLLFAPNIQSDNVSLQKVRALYSEAADDEMDCESLLKMLPEYSDTQDETLKAYRASATMVMAKHAWSPMSKLSYFKNGKEHLQQSVEANPNNVEIRFLRFSIQTEAPAFLGYNDEIAEDKYMLLSNFSAIQDTNLKKTIAEYLLASNGLTLQEKQSLKL